VKGARLFASHPRPRPAPRLLQHFGGWEVEASRPAFDPARVTLMDFDAPPAAGEPPASDAIPFVYMLPMSPTRALVESTCISPRPWPRARHDARVRAYLEARGIGDAHVLRREHGVLPMDVADAPEAAPAGSRVVRLGRAGGLTKASTGYTAQRAARHARQLADTLAATGRPAPPPPPARRFRWYDGVFLEVLRAHPELAPEIFRRLLAPRQLDDALDFLDERTSPWTEARLLTALPWPPFIAAALRRPAPGPRSPASRSRPVEAR
jgi:lycopene beta-cyclase